MSFFGKNRDAFGGEQLLQQQQQAQVNQVVDGETQVIDEQTMAEAETMEAHEQAMSEAGDRLEKAKTYDMVRQNPFIEQTSQQAYEVQTEIQKFVELRLQLLMGMKPDPNLLQYVQELVSPGSGPVSAGGAFDSEQTVALQAWANKLLKRPSYFEVQGKPAATKPAPAATKSEPAMKVVAAPAPQRPKTIRTKPIATQAAPQPAPQPLPAPQRRPVAPVVTQAQPQEEDLTPPTPKKTMEVQAANGKIVRVSLDEQAQPAGNARKPFPNSANGIDNTNGGINASAGTARGVQNRLISHFLNS